jgi:hypothetical protein
MLLLTAQFVQVTLNFSQSSYAVALDEEQKEKEKVGKQDGKETKEVLPSAFASSNLVDQDLLNALAFVHNRLNKPFLDQPTPPPDYSC